MGSWTPGRDCAALSASPYWSPGTPFGICYFRPTFCSFMPLRARQISERAARAGQGIPKLVERSRVDPIACFRDTGSTRHFMAPRNGDEERRVITVALLSRRRPPAGKPPTTAARKVTRPPADCSSTLPHEAGRWHVSGPPRSEVDEPPDRTRLRVGSGNASPRQGTEEPRCHTRIFQERRAIGMLTQSAVSIGTASRPRRRKRRSTRRS